jgi:DNA-binding transcriptional ArsR family regulator
MTQGCGLTAPRGALPHGARNCKELFAKNCLQFYRGGMERTTHQLTPASLKALAHPLRVRLVGLLRLEGPATATSLAQRTGESSGLTSYHLRQLEKAGFVVEDSERGNARDRWWKAAQDSTRMESSSLDDDPETQIAADAYLHTVAQLSWRRLEHWLSTSRRWSKRWQSASNLSDLSLSLTPAEALRLGDAMDALVESYRREPRKGDQRVVVQYQVFPEKDLP